ncbi:RedY protein [Streptomyces sp. JV178]|uniref:RedY protein n=1 Tax=Streptomyces sp. JV178 TaxID=858632 RepID=UPI000C1B0371|nr:RedY protein [Streptomyces sp. JV178]PIM71513.1 RedY protein [Streptomyces sp. JV178]
MHVIVHRIRLHEGVDPARFETWVRECDYRAAAVLKSLHSFAVHRVSTHANAPHEYFEVISVTSPEEFERDMATDTFRRLVTAFDTMASVVDEIFGERIEPGYSAD